MTQAPSSLPPAYAHFKPVFERLSDQLRETITGQLEQLEPFVHLVDETAVSNRGDMAGLGSLTRHGELSNILQSELLLRTEVPLEFLRRIAEAETLYHEKEYQDDGVRRIIRLMISVGPGTLGHGRIFSLAALFFLARVANLRQETLHWSYLPNATGAVWFDEISVNTIKRFLKTASFREMTAHDAAEARAIWARLHVSAKASIKPVMIDWVIGTQPRENGRLNSFAVAQSPRSIGYRLNPPDEQKPRGAQLYLKRGGKAHRPVQFVFPDDKVCLSALNTPFAPIKPDGAIVQSPASESQRMEGWEPRYISAPSGKVKFVKITGGILILFHATDEHFKGHYFLPLMQNSKIAGLRLKEQQLHVLLQTVRGPQEQLEYSVIDLSSNGTKPIFKGTKSKALPSAQLFRNQNRYALPVLAGADHPSYDATNGKSFSLSFDANGDARFSADLDASLVIFSNGQHRVVRADVNGTQILRTLRANNSTVHEFSLDSTAFDEAKLRSMLYVSTHGQLAFSIMPNIWALPGKCSLGHKGVLTQITATQQCEFASYETPLSLRCGSGDIYATVWSDVARGGDGSIRNLQIRHDRVLSRTKLFDVRHDIGTVAEIIQADDGIWIVTADQAGVPETLHRYHSGSGREKHIAQYEFEDLRKDAQTVLLGGSGYG